jgi:hypothetical protein
MDEFEPRIRELLQAFPTMPATVIAERVGWMRGSTVFSDRVRAMRPVYLPPDPASRTGYVAGEIAQCEVWFPDIELPVGFGRARDCDSASCADDGHGICAVPINGPWSALQWTTGRANLPGVPPVGKWKRRGTPLASPEIRTRTRRRYLSGHPARKDPSHDRTPVVESDLVN